MSNKPIYSNFKPTRLYIKRIGNLWYFGKYTKSDIEKYSGSGHIWRKKIQKYGKESIIHVWHSDWYTDQNTCQQEALKFSIENDIVNSTKWANLMLENGIGVVMNDAIAKKISEKQILTHRKRPQEEKDEIIKMQVESRKKSWNEKPKFIKNEEYAKRSQTLKKTLALNPPKGNAVAMQTRLRNMTQEEKIEVNRKRSESQKGKPKPQKRCICEVCGAVLAQKDLTRFHKNCSRPRITVHK